MALYLYMHNNPTVVMRCRAKVTNPIDYFFFVNLNYQSVTFGSKSAVRPGMTLLLGSAPGLDDYGRQRINKIDDISFYFCLTGQGTHDGELIAHDGDYITVIEEYRVWAKLPFISGGTIYKDGYIMAAQTGLYNNVVEPPPKAAAGPAMAGTIASGTGKLRVAFDGINSFQIFGSLGVGTVTNYQWEIGDGALITGTLTSQQITVDFPAGFRYIHLTVTSSVGLSHTCHVAVFARDPANDACLRHIVTNHHVTAKGQELSFRIMQPLPRDQYRDNALVLFWEDEPASPSDRSHMRFVGWHQQDDTQRTMERTAMVQQMTLNCLDVAGRLRALPGFPQIVHSTIAPNGVGGVYTPVKWNETKYPTLFYYLWYLLYWHSTALEVADLILGDQILNNFHFLERASDQGSIYDQAENFCISVTPDHHLTCNEQGQLLLRVDPQIMYTGDRDTFVATVDGWDERTWTAIKWTEIPVPRVNQIYTGAVVSTSDYILDSHGNPTIPVVFSKAPSEARGQGITDVQVSGRIVQSQFDLNTVEGNRYARQNSPFGNAQITLPLQNINPAFDIARMEWIQLYLPAYDGADDWLRPPQDNYLKRGLVTEMTITYDYRKEGLVRTCNVTWEAETSGPPAMTFTPIPGID